MALSQSSHPNYHQNGRIRVDDESSFDLIHLIEKELRASDAMRRDSSGRNQVGLTNELNRYMRRLRRMLREVVRTRDEMGWDPIELSDLAQRR